MPARARKANTSVGSGSQGHGGSRRAGPPIPPTKPPWRESRHGALAAGASGRVTPRHPRGHPETQPSPVEEAGYAIAIAPIMLAIGGGKPWFLGKYNQGVNGYPGG